MGNHIPKWLDMEAWGNRGKSVKTEGAHTFKK